MNKLYVLLALLLALAIYGGMRANNPLNTELPFGSTDLSSVSDELASLDDPDRKRVQDYVKRTNGDYLPAGMGDPDDPMTARTFAEAIELQKRFEAKMAVQEAEAAKMKAERDRRYQPLRDALGLSLIKREMLTPTEIHGPGSYDDGQRRAVTTFRISNRSGETIVGFDAKIDLRKKFYPSTEFGILVDCWLEKQDRLGPGDEMEVRCGRERALTTVTDPDYMAMALTDMDLRWEPKRIRFASGKFLEFRD